jgi:FkbM family methyltransferase
MQVRSDLIFDIGAHTGGDAAFYLQKGFKVVAVEPYPPHFEHLRQRFAQYISAGSFHVEPFGIGKVAGEGTLFIHESHSEWHRSEKDPNSPSFGKLKPESVRYILMSKLFEKYGVPYYLKIDIEGSDWLAITAIGAERKPVFVSFEVHQETELCLEHLLFNGYRSFQIVEQSKHRLTLPPFPPREGEFAKYQFDAFCSGLFGRELPSEWCDIKSIRAQFPLDWSGHRWYDIHASVWSQAAGKLTDRMPVPRQHGR